MSRLYIGGTPISAVYMGGKRYDVKIGLKKQEENILYQLPAPITFNGDVNNVIDTGLKLWESDISFTIEADFVTDIKTSEQAMFSLQNCKGPYNGLKWGWHPNTGLGYYFVVVGNSYQNAPMDGMNRNYVGECHLKITHTKDTNLYEAVCSTNDGDYTAKLNTSTFVAHQLPLIIGADHHATYTYHYAWTGTLNAFKVIGGDPV